VLADDGTFETPFTDDIIHLLPNLGDEERHRNMISEPPLPAEKEPLNAAKSEAAA
jgi:hypothetical protein